MLLAPSVADADGRRHAADDEPDGGIMLDDTVVIDTGFAMRGRWPPWRRRSGKVFDAADAGEE